MTLFDNSTVGEGLFENIIREADPADFSSFDKFEEIKVEEIEVLEEQAINQVAGEQAMNQGVGDQAMDTTTTTLTEPCIENWTPWSDFDTCSDRGAGPYQKQRERRKFDSAACQRDGHLVEYEYDNQDCDYSGPNAYWGTGKFDKVVFETSLIMIHYFCRPILQKAACTYDYSLTKRVFAA